MKDAAGPTLWVLHVVAALSLLLAIAASVFWAASYRKPHDWRLLGSAHSSELMRVPVDRRGGVSLVPADLSIPAPHGFWDALWALSHSGSLTLVAHAVDYDGHIARIDAVAPAVTVELSGPLRIRATVFDLERRAGVRSRLLGFSWDADAGQARSDRGSVRVQARSFTVPYWSIVLIGLPLWLRWLAANRRRRLGRRGA
jgi:hypothetical protein